jgi:hypothetical protein
VIKIPFTTHRPGAGCGSASIRDLLEHNGHRLSEPMCFGLGSGLNVAYHHGDASVPDSYYRAPYTIITGRAEAPYVDTCNVLGVKMKICRTHDPARAWAEVKGMLDRSIPVVVDLDREEFMGSLGQQNVLTQLYGWRFGGHQTIVIGYDEEANTVDLIENMLQGPITIPMDMFHRSRNSADLYPSENEWYIVETPPKLQELRTAIKMALIRNVHSMRYQRYRGFGLRGLDWWYEEIAAWPDIMDQHRLIASIWMAHIQSEALSGGGMFRKMYARFLREADDYLEEPGLVEAARIYRQVAESWTELTSNMLGIVLEEADVSLFKEPSFHKLRDSIYELEYKGVKALEEVTLKWA